MKKENPCKECKANQLCLWGLAGKPLKQCIENHRKPPRKCPICGKENPLDTLTLQDGKIDCCEECRTKLRYPRIMAHRKISDTLQCNHCKITDPRLLCIDHIHNDGAIERKTTKGIDLYNTIRKMTKEQARAKYQLLCHNCNYLKQLETYT